ARLAPSAKFWAALFRFFELRAALGVLTMSTSTSTPAKLAPKDNEVSSSNEISRRGFFTKLGILFNGLAATVLAVPIVGFLASSIWSVYVSVSRRSILP